MAESLESPFSIVEIHVGDVNFHKPALNYTRIYYFCDTVNSPQSIKLNDFCNLAVFYKIALLLMYSDN